MFPFKVQLVQGCKSETEPINIKSVVQRVTGYQVLLVLCNVLHDTKYYWRRITKPIPSFVAVVQHDCQVTVSTSLHTHKPFLQDTKYCWRHITKCFELTRVCKSFKMCKNGWTVRNLSNRRRNANESLAEKSNRLRSKRPKWNWRDRRLTKSAYTFRNLYSVRGNYMLLSQE
jgi:hypothetical protein